MTDEQGRVFNELQVAAAVRAHPAWFRLNDQMHWYDRKSLHCQRWYKRLKVTQVSLAVLIPVMSLLPEKHVPWTTSIAGALIAILEGVQQLNQYSTLWVTYRTMAERLKQEKYLFLSSAGPYSDLILPDQLATLSERVEECISTEHANWINETSRAATKPKLEGR